MILTLAKYYLSLHYWNIASADSVRKMQLKKFRVIFEYARQNSKFYKDFYHERGVSNLKIENYEDIEKVPIINKDILRKYAIRDLMTCEIDDNLNIHSTSGSTGEPFKIAFNKFEDYSAHVRLTKELMNHGYHPLKKMVLLSRYEPGHTFEVEEDLSKVGFLQEKIRIFPREVISIFEPVEEIIRKLQHIKPFLVWSTPSVIQMVAVELERRNQRLDIPMILLMAETVSPEQVALFTRRVCHNFLDVYGCMESPSIGFSYNSIGFKNIVCNSTLTEVINRRTFNGQNVGDAVVTNLINKTMPFIRFNTGDYVGILDDKRFPSGKIGTVYGRFDDILTLGDGNTLMFHQTYQLFSGFHECEQYKFIQKAHGDILLQLKIKPDGNKEEVKQKALEKWNQKFNSFPITVEFVDSFAIDSKTGKFKVIEKIKSI
jgi:phenylacetate-CoA ligase